MLLLFMTQFILHPLFLQFRLSNVYLAYIFLGPTLDLPWTYEQFLTKLFVTTPKLSIVNCLRILNFL